MNTAARKRHPWPHEEIGEDFSYAVCGGNGWSCQDGSRVRIGDTEADVVANGLDAAGRRFLKYEEAKS